MTRYLPARPQVVFISVAQVSPIRTLDRFPGRRNETVAEYYVRRSCLTPGRSGEHLNALREFAVDVILLWLNTHRIIAVACVALSLWSTAYYWYFGGLVRTFLGRSKPHSWTVNMLSKTATRAGREELR
jgi:hypothetical protein